MSNAPVIDKIKKRGFELARINRSWKCISLSLSEFDKLNHELSNAHPPIRLSLNKHGCLMFVGHAIIVDKKLS